MTATARATETAERELLITRVFDAPRALVFKAWTAPEHLVRWWGPHGFTLPSCQLELRPGGRFACDMRSPEGTLHRVRGVYREIDPPQRLAFTWAWLDENDRPRHETLVTVTFEEDGARTKLTLHQAVFESVTARDAHHHGWSESLERLAAHVAGGTMAQASRLERSDDLELVITRVFDAPRSLLFKLWTQPEHLARWWGPQGFTTVACTMDVRPGGAWFRRMRSPEDTLYTKRGVYREVVAPERLVFTYVNENADGTRGPETLVTVTFEEHGTGTRLTLRQTGFETITDRDAHEGGWASCMERFAGYLAAQLGG